jgi:CoA:oxalate CoA-transferase
VGRPLEGIRVLDLTRVLSGPHVTRTLCDLGAEVIKVEPPTGDLSRFANPRINGMSTYYAQQNTGKRNVSVDLSMPEAVELLLGLVEHCDVVVENFRPGVMERMGLGYDAVSLRQPRIVYASLSGYGQTGPWAQRRAYAAVVGAETGYTRHQSEVRDGPPANDPHSNADVSAGMECAIAVLAALFDHSRTGRGARVEVSMAETMLYVNEHVHDQLWDGEIRPEWVRSFEPQHYPVLTAANGEQVVVSAHPADRHHFAAFIDAAGHTELAEDPRFVGPRERLANLDVLAAVIHGWAATVPDGATVERELSGRGLATGRLRSVRDLAGTEWAAAREAFVAVDDRSGGQVRIPNAPFWIDGEHLGIQGVPRFRGEDNRAVLHELLGLDAAALDDLEARGVLSARLPS